VRHALGEEVPLAVDLPPKKKTQNPPTPARRRITEAASMEAGRRGHRRDARTLKNTQPLHI